MQPAVHEYSPQSYWQKTRHTETASLQAVVPGGPWFSDTVHDGESCRLEGVSAAVAATVGHRRR
jgi:hypothetical protein